MDHYLQGSRIREQFRVRPQRAAAPSESLDKTIKKSPETVMGFKCIKCQKHFREEREMMEHIRVNHNFCRLCQSFYDESKEKHRSLYCPEERVACLGCSGKVKRKNLDQHIEACCYRMCFKCKNPIYVKAFAYHLQYCSKVNNKLIKECKRPPRVVPTNFSSETRIQETVRNRSRNSSRTDRSVSISVRLCSMV